MQLTSIIGFGNSNRATLSDITGISLKDNFDPERDIHFALIENPDKSLKAIDHSVPKNRFTEVRIDGPKMSAPVLEDEIIVSNPGSKSKEELLRIFYDIVHPGKHMGIKRKPESNTDTLNSVFGISHTNIQMNPGTNSSNAHEYYFLKLPLTNTAKILNHHVKGALIPLAKAQNWEGGDIELSSFIKFGRSKTGKFGLIEFRGTKIAIDHSGRVFIAKNVKSE